MKILALDPGTTKTGWCLLDDGRPVAFGVLRNSEMMDEIRNTYEADVMAIEMIASYGMAVGREVFETCVWIGRFLQTWRDPDAVMLVYRKDVKMHLCGTNKAKDANIRQALLDIYPATGGGATPQVGTKSQPGPLYGVSSHVWPALGVAVTVQARLKDLAKSGPGVRISAIPTAQPQEVLL